MRSCSPEGKDKVQVQAALGVAAASGDRRRRAPQPPISPCLARHVAEPVCPLHPILHGLSKGLFLQGGERARSGIAFQLPRRSLDLLNKMQQR